MLNTFKNIQARARVDYLTPQGQIRTVRAQRLLLFPFHIVGADARGQPVVVDSYNYLGHRNPRSN